MNPDHLTTTEKTAISKIQAKKLRNWTPDKGTPEEYDARNTNQYKIPKLKWRVLKEDPKKEHPKMIVDCDIQIRALAYVKLDVALNTINGWELLSRGGHGRGRRHGRLIRWIDGDGSEELRKGKRVVYQRLEPKPETFTAIITYPFNSTVEITIPPYIKVHSDNNGKSKKHSDQHFAYILWTIARVYQEIYKKHWKKVGVWGHALGDLYFEGLAFYPDCRVEPFIGS